MRRAHLLKHNVGSDTPQNCLWFDTETRFETVDDLTIYHHLKFGYACFMRRHHTKEWTDEEWLRFTTRSEFWEFVCSKVRGQTTLYLFCHNTSFDLPVLDVFNALPSFGYSLRSAIIDAPPTILRFCNGNKRIIILDTMNFFRMSLKVLGREIGVEKLDMPEDNDLGITWDTYGKRDVEIIRDACIHWFGFLETNDMGCFAPTLAGQAMNLFRHRYMKHEILIDDNERALSLTREGYHGGRTECFFIGKRKDTFTLLDVNSMYPSVMADYQYPRRLLSHTRRANLEDVAIWLQQYSVCARVILRTMLPFAAVRAGSKLVFPVGEFDCILSTPELRYALRHAEIVSVIEVAVYEQALLFSTMMRDLYLARLQAKNSGDPVTAFLYRKMMNSFYGKWGQDGAKWNEIDHIDDLSCRRWMEIDHDTQTVIWRRQLGGLVQERGKDEESKDSFPAIAAHVTAYARIKLWDLIQLAGIEHVYYVDTDSLLVDGDGLARLASRIDESALGMLSIKGEYDEIEIWGNKDYRFGSKERHKGVRKDAIWIDSHTVQQSKWSGLRGLVAAGVVDKPITRTIRKHLNRAYDKGLINPDGRVSPFWVSLDSPL